MKSNRLLRRVTAGVCIGIFSLMLASPCLGKTKRLENGCPAESGLSPKEWVCYTLPEAGEIRTRQIDMESLLISEYAKRPERLGFSVSCRVGAGIGIDGGLGLLPPEGGVYYGFTFSLGRR